MITYNIANDKSVLFQSVIDISIPNLIGSARNKCAYFIIYR
jgi:hypothetical protein